MNLVLAIIPVLLLIILMAFFKMSGDKSSVISLVVTMLIAFFGFHFPVNDLLSIKMPVELALDNIIHTKSLK